MSQPNLYNNNQKAEPLYNFIITNSFLKGRKLTNYCKKLKPNIVSVNYLRCKNSGTEIYSSEKNNITQHHNVK